MMNQPDTPPRSPPCVAIACLSGGRTRAPCVQAGCTSFPRVFRNSWMGRTQIRFSRSLRSLSRTAVLWLQCLTSLRSGATVRRWRNVPLIKFSMRLPPSFPDAWITPFYLVLVTGQRSRRPWPIVNHLTQSYYSPTLPVPVALIQPFLRGNGYLLTTVPLSDAICG